MRLPATLTPHRVACNVQRYMLQSCRGSLSPHILTRRPPLVCNPLSLFPLGIMTSRSHALDLHSPSQAHTRLSRVDDSQFHCPVKNFDAFPADTSTLPDPQDDLSGDSFDGSEPSDADLLEQTTSDVSRTASSRRGLRPPRIRSDTGTNPSRTFLAACKTLLGKYTADTATLEDADRCYHLARLLDCSGHDVSAQNMYDEWDSKRGTIGPSHPSGLSNSTTSPELRMQADAHAWQQLLDRSGSGASDVLVYKLREMYVKACAEHETARARWENGHATCDAVVDWAKAELAAEFPDSTIGS